MTTLAARTWSECAVLDDHLSDLVEQFMERLQAGESIDPSGFAVAHPAHAEDLLAVLPAIAALAEVGRSQTPALYFSTGEEGIEARTLGDFQIVREVGRGGMGVVYEAVQVSLGRRVALKTLPHAAASEPRQLARFHVEAHAVATLNHPNIVPLFAVGSDQGIHYYVMQYVEGRSLADVITDLRRDRKSRDSAGPTLSAADAARLGIQAADALDHAHSLGILHRDIKPANMLIDNRGHLWIVDFGLARIQAGSNLTLTGEPLGTLRYMSPEQALAGGMVDPRSDVYSLGLSLYELLVLRPAFDDGDRRELLRKIAHEEPLAPRKANPTIPRHLETIILKAIAKEPAWRYASAGALADDLRCFLDDRPILGRRPGMTELAGRWVRRHRLTAAVFGAALILATTGLAIGTVVLWREQSRTNENLELALNALDRLDLHLGQDGGDADPEQAPVIFESLSEGLRLYERLAQKNPHNRLGRWGAARAYRRMADIQNSSKQLDQSEAAYRKGDDLLAGLLADDPSNLGYQDERAVLMSHRGRLVYLVGGQRVFRGSLAAEKPLRTAIEIDEQLINQVPTEIKYQRRIVENSCYLMGVLFVARRPLELSPVLEKARDILQKAAPGSVEDQLDLVVLFKLLGDVMHATERTEEGSRAYDRSISLLLALPRETTFDRAFRHSVVKLMARLGQQSFCDTNQPRKELEYYIQVVPAWDQLIDGLDLTAGEQATRAQAHCFLAYRLENQNRAVEAVAPATRAVESYEKLLKSHPQIADYVHGVAQASESLGRLLLKAQRPQGALAYLDRSIELRSQKYRCKERIAWYLVGYPNPFAARAIELANELVAEKPLEATAWSRLGAARVRAGDWAGAREALERVARMADGGSVDDWFFQAIACWHLGDKASARRLFHQAIDELGKSHSPHDEIVDDLHVEAMKLIEPYDRSRAEGSRGEVSTMHPT